MCGEKGSPDTLRDSRGMSIKFYTGEGVWDLVCSNMPAFGVRDPLLVNYIFNYFAIKIIMSFRSS